MGRGARLGRLLLGWILGSLTLAACTGDITPAWLTPSPPPFRHFDDQGLSFDYPGTWNKAQFVVISSFSNVIVDLSTAPLADPCDRTPGSIACVRSAVAALEPDGVLVEWTRRSWPGWTFDPTAGRPTQVGGRRATLQTFDSPPDASGCQGIGAECALLVTIDDPTPDWNWTEMRACLRGPALDALRAQVDAMLGSVTWNG